MKKGTYFYSWVRWDDKGCRAFEAYKIRVEVVGESKTQYHVKYLEQHANRSAIGSLHWVKKTKVKLDTPVVKPAQQLELRLPYKDE